MLRRAEADDPASSLGSFGRIGRVAVRWPLVVIGGWIALAVTLFLVLPPLAKIAGEKPPEFLPSDAPVLVANNAMIKEFNESDSQNSLLVVLTNDNGLGPAQEEVYRKLVDNLRADHAVVMLQDFISTPALRDVVTSKDHKAWYLPVGLAGELATPAASESYLRAVEIVKASTTGTSLTAHLTGPAATVGDMTAVGERDVHVIEIATALMVLTILLVVYRNPITMALPLVTIGISLVVAQQIIAWFAQQGLSISLSSRQPCPGTCGFLSCSSAREDSPDDDDVTAGDLPNGIERQGQSLSVRSASPLAAGPLHSVMPTGDRRVGMIPQLACARK